MKLGIVLAGVLRTKIDFGELCRWAAANGYPAIDLPPDRDDAADVARAAGLEVASTGGMPPLFRVDDAERENAVRDAISRLDRAAKMDVPFVQLTHERVPDAGDDETLRRVTAALTPVCAHAEKLGIKLVIENWHNQGRNFAISPYNWRRLFEAVPSPALGLCFDPSHLVVLGIDWQRALREFGSRVYYAHAKDTDLDAEGMYQHGIATPFFGRRPVGAGTQGWWRYTLPGFGVVDWGRYIGTLREVGFDGILAVEHEDDVWGWRSDVPTTLEGLDVARRYLSQYL